MFLIDTFGEELRRRENNKRRLMTAEFVDWHPNIKWAKELNIKASSYQPGSLFDVAPNRLSRPDPNKVDDRQRVISPGGLWQYQSNTLETGSCLATWCGGVVGTVMFDGAVTIPAIYSRLGEVWNTDPWMSLTPAEMLSLRVGTRKARGHVVVAGLGMGHQLVEVALRKSVTKITLVEKDQGIVDWILPIIEPTVTQRCGKLLEVVVGDAYEELPKIKADVALIDIFESYGNNSWDMEDYMPPLPNIKKVWAWGAASL